MRRWSRIASYMAVCLAALPPPVLAQTASQPSHTSSRRATSSAPVLVAADELQYEEDLGLVIAKGNVELSQKDQIILADTVTYNQRTDTVTASGHVSMLEPSGEVMFANYAELHDQMRDGFIKDVRMLLSDRSRLAANTGRRIDGNRTELRHGVYSPCDLCQSDPSRPPVWQIRADRVVHDQTTHIVEYHDAVMEIEGLPVLYTPYLSHPDPSVKRESGFLPPSFGHSSNLGYHASTPYYWTLGPDKDATFTPLLTSDAGAVLAGEYRQRFTFGETATDGSIAYTNREDDLTGTTSDHINSLRGHFFSTGNFDIDDDWRTNYQIQRASDQTYLQRFNFTSIGTFLTSHANLEGFVDHSYYDADAYMFQSMRPGVGDTTQPIVAPVATYGWMSDQGSLGDRWGFTGNVQNLFRPNGADIRRLSAGGNWQLPFSTGIGDRLTLTTNLRTDAYYTSSLALSPSGPDNTTALAGRIFPQVGLKWSYPWVRRGDGNTEVIEPIVAAFASPVGGNPAKIPDEDSAAFEFDSNSLFRSNRFPGYDRVDSGQRIDYGIRTSLFTDGGLSSHLLFGESYRAQSNPTNYPAGSGINGHRSDFVGSLVVSPTSYIDALYQFRLSKDNLQPQSQRVSLTGGPPSLRLGIDFLDVSAVPNVTNSSPQEQLSATIATTITPNWTVGLLGTHEFVGTVGNLASGVVLIYHDECMSFITSVGYSGIRDRDIQPGTTVLFTIVFKNLGEFNLASFGTGSASAPTMQLP